MYCIGCILPCTTTNEANAMTPMSASSYIGSKGPRAPTYYYRMGEAAAVMKEEGGRSRGKKRKGRKEKKRGEHGQGDVVLGRAIGETHQSQAPIMPMRGHLSCIAASRQPPLRPWHMHRRKASSLQIIQPPTAWNSCLLQASVSSIATSK